MPHVKQYTIHNKAVIDIRLRPGIATPCMTVAVGCSLHLSASRPLRPNVTPSIKPEVYNIAQRHQKRIEPRSSHSLGSRDMLANRQTQRHTDEQTDAHTDGLITILRNKAFYRHQTPPRSHNAARCAILRDTKSTHRHTAHYGQT